MAPATPASSHSPEGSATDPAQGASPVERAVLEYLRSRGFTSAEQSLLKDIEKASPEDKRADTSVSANEYIKKIAALVDDKSGEKDSGNVLQSLSTLNNLASIQNLISTIGASGAEEILSLDPTDKHEGFRELENWVDGSLDMYRPEFRPILFPIFCHFYLDLIQHGFKDAALNFFSTFYQSLAPLHTASVHHLRTLLLPSHVQNDELAQRFRNEKYVLKMSRSGFSLLVGWLTEGMGGEALGAGEGFSGEKGKRGRAAVMRVVNNHLRFDVTSASTTSVSPHAWEESTGLLSSLIPQQTGTTSPLTSAEAYNVSKGDLKLGPALVSEELRAEADRMLREQAHPDHEPTGHPELHYPRQSVIPGVTYPAEADLLPSPPTFKMMDVKREVEKVKDARKLIKLDPAALNGVDLNSPNAAAARSRALPSICAYTLHDVQEGVPCCVFSPDFSLLAAGFEESCIRLWSLKGEKLRGLRSDFPLNSIRDSASLRKIREKGGSTTRKLIGHSGPVYSLSFDPTCGSAGPPAHLLSASGDGTTRLWSLDTMTNVVAYRGHQNPVWDVEWSPMGIYFATGSRDHTARLWSTDRISALRVYAGHLSDVNCVKFHPNTLYLATASSDWTARLWDVQRGSCVRVFIGHQGIVSSLAISPDGRYLASSGEDLAINLWDLGSGKRIKKMSGHTASIYSLAFSAESSLLVSGGADWTVRCWDVKGAGGLPTKKENVAPEADQMNGVDENVETVDLLATFPTKRTPIINVHFTPRNLCLVAGSYLNPESR